MRAFTAGAIALAAAALTCATALPAAANDASVDLAQSPVGPKVHHGMWVDAIDTLRACLGGTGTYYQAVAKIRPADGVGPTFSVTDSTIGDGCRSTGNLSIPEDERYIMTLTVYGREGRETLSGSVAFYT